LFDYWTLKEAYLKGIGTGLLVDPRKIAFDIDTKTFLKAAAAKPRPERNWNFRQPELVTNYSMAVATNRKGAELEIVTAAMSTDSKIRLIS
jgi:phosphopantetheinyl transferase